MNGDVIAPFQDAVRPMVVVLAAGRGARFRAAGGQGQKLQAVVRGKTVLQHVLDAVAASGLPYHLEVGPHPGMGDSIAAAVRANAQAEGWLILPADLPLVKSETICAVARALAHATVVVPRYRGEYGHPVAFARTCLADLLALTGEAGAKQVLRHEEGRGGLHILDVDDVGVVADVDTPEALARADLLMACAEMSNRGGMLDARG